MGKCVRHVKPGAHVDLRSQTLSFRHVSSDVDYYKKKAAELKGQVNSLKAISSEKQRQIDELRRQTESQNLLSSLKRKRSSL